MSAPQPIVFEIQPSGLTKAKLGMLCVGEIRPGSRGACVGAFYKLRLDVDGEKQEQRPVESISIARRNLLFRIANCFESIPGCEATAEAIRCQGEAERVA